MSYWKPVLMDKNEGIYIDVTDLMNRLNNIRRNPKGSYKPTPDPEPETENILHYWSPIHVGDSANFKAWKISCLCTYKVTTDTEEPWKNRITTTSDYTYFKDVFLCSGLNLSTHKVVSEPIGLILTKYVSNLGMYDDTVSGDVVPYYKSSAHGDDASVGNPVGYIQTSTGYAPDDGYSPSYYSYFYYLYGFTVQRDNIFPDADEEWLSDSDYVYLTDLGRKAYKETTETEIKELNTAFALDKTNKTFDVFEGLTPKQAVRQKLKTTTENPGIARDVSDSYLMRTTIKDFVIYTIELPDIKEITLTVGNGITAYTQTTVNDEWALEDKTYYVTDNNSLLYTNIPVNTKIYNNKLVGYDVTYCGYGEGYGLYIEGSLCIKTDSGAELDAINHLKQDTLLNYNTLFGDVLDVTALGTEGEVRTLQRTPKMLCMVTADSAIEAQRAAEQCILKSYTWCLDGSVDNIKTVKTGELVRNAYDELYPVFTDLPKKSITVTLGVELERGYHIKEYYAEFASSFTEILERFEGEISANVASKVQGDITLVNYTSNNLEKVLNINSPTINATKFSSCYDTDLVTTNKHIIAYFIKDDEGMKLLAEYRQSGKNAYVTPCQGRAFFHLDNPTSYLEDATPKNYAYINFHQFRSIKGFLTDMHSADCLSYLSDMTSADDFISVVPELTLVRVPELDETAELAGTTFVDINKKEVNMELWDTEKLYYASEATRDSFWKSINGTPCYKITAGYNKGTTSY